MSVRQICAFIKETPTNLSPYTACINHNSPRFQWCLGKKRPYLLTYIFLPTPPVPAENFVFRRNCETLNITYGQDRII